MQKPRNRRSQPRRNRGRLSSPHGNRLSIAFLIVSSLVICSLLAAGLVTAASLDLFGGGSNDNSDNGANFEDPNDDLIGAQQTLVAQNPDDIDALLLLANLLGNSNRLDEAIPLYEQATQMRPDDASIRLDFARALSDGGKPADAEVQFLKALEIEPNDQAANYYLAELYRTWNPSRAAEAVPLYQRVVRIDSATFLAEQAMNQLESLGAATPVASAVASPQAGGTP